MPDSSNPLAWVAYADEDFEFAVLGLEQHPRSATFMLAQASEKYLKALLLHHNIAVPRSHDLVLLLSLVPDAPKPDAAESYAAQLISRAVIPNRTQAIFQNQLLMKQKPFNAPQKTSKPLYARD
jgi:HEPN domain-containing protein